jgi:protein-S-isoprenylcysteine O-methyltransferase Ste14
MTSQAREPEGREPMELGRRLPSLGPRGEGWLAGQVLLFVAIVVAPVGGWSESLAATAQTVGNALVVVGLIVITLGAVGLGRNLTPFPKPRRDAELVEAGVYRWIRHPIYVGLIIVAVGASLVRASTIALLVSVILAVFLDLKARREEVLLSDRFPEYAAYRRRTRRFIPGLY